MQTYMAEQNNSGISINIMNLHGEEKQALKQTPKLKCFWFLDIIDYVAFKMKSGAMLNLMMQVGDLFGEADNEQKRPPLRWALNERAAK